MKAGARVWHIPGVVRAVRGIEIGEARVAGPLEIAAIYDHATDRGTVPTMNLVQSG